jgi:hypothetical protein
MSTNRRYAYNPRQRAVIIEWVKRGLCYQEICGLLIERGWPIIARQGIHHYKTAYASELVGIKPAYVRGSKEVFAGATRRAPSAYVYLFWMEGGFYKIGIASNVARRLKEFQHLPYEVRLIHSFHAENAEWAEVELHAKFADKRVRGEWFRLTPEDVEYVCAIERVGFIGA